MPMMVVMVFVVGGYENSNGSIGCDEKFLT